MSWSTAQKGRVHQYAAWAGLTDFAYRNILYSRSGARSAADPHLNELDFDHIMAALEAALDEAIQANQVKPPKKIRDLSYWRKRLGGPGRPTTRQLKRIRELTDAFLGVEPNKTYGYVLYLLRHIAQNPNLQSAEELSSVQAEMAITSLRGRVRRAVAGNRAAAANLEDVLA